MSSWPHDPRPSAPTLVAPRTAPPTEPRTAPRDEPLIRPREPLPERRPRIPQPRLPHTPATYVTLGGADWLASASPHPHSVHALWAESPAAPIVLPCGTAFDVVGVPALFGRRVLDRLWTNGPGSGPVAAQRGRLLLFAAPGTAQRLPALLTWEEWARAMPPLLCHGTGDAVTVPPLYPPGEDEPAPPASRWLVAPEARHPWLPDAEGLLWACVRVARASADTALTSTTPFSAR
ncbi:bifunctional DNA primase/polymerase [Streptomyces sp. NPDC046215]|uniref:DNA primase/polymerase bifunctional N-terminal domain-containing protein n=1 Tax=Streptomyces stramineus TaxID=173861 RepID=A0ABN0ZTA1_9ACTN